MPPTRQVDSAPGPAFERLRALAALLPAAILLWPGPGAPLRGDPLPSFSGAGWAALWAIPAAAAALASRKCALSRVAWAYLAFLALGALALGLGRPTDTLGASRAVQLGLAALACLLAGASLGPVGRRWLACGAVLVSLLALAPVAFSSSSGLAGALGNKASTSEAALAGALAGAVLVAAPGVWMRILGSAAALLLAVHAGRGPVLASAVALLVALALAALLASGERAAARRLWLACVWVVLLGAVWGARFASRPTLEAKPTAEAPANLPSSNDLRGLEVRKLIASSSLRMLASAPLFGVGPGQFSAAFPPFRDPREIELSSLGHNLPGQVTEVEHAHDDWLQGWLDAGLLGGFAWLCFLVLAGWHALAALRSSEPARAALGAGALGLLLAALARAPLLDNPASACIAFAFFGAVSTSRADARRAGIGARAAALATVLVLAWQVPRARALVEHGRALARALESPREASAQLERALATCPDSVQARALSARFVPRAEPTAEGSVPAAVAAWHAVLELRPHHFEAWMETGNAWARAGELDAGRSAFERALDLDPGDPDLRANLARLEVEAGRADVALEHVRALEAAQRLPPGWLAGGAAEALRRLDLVTARALLAHLHPEWGELSAQQAWERSQALEDASPELARALKALANLEWAREHMAAGAPQTAVRNYRQAQQALAWRPEPEAEVRVPGILSLELAAALLSAGEQAEAEREVSRAAAPPGALGRLPDWAAAALREAGLAGR
jgi:O-antigen ligase